MKMQLEARHVPMDFERHHYPGFHYQKINTQVEASWKDIPESFIKGRNSENCKVTLSINLTPFEYHEVTICLLKHKTKRSDPIFYKNTEINIFGDTYTPSQLLKDTQAVTGFIKDNPNSKVSGFLINGNFYGQLRFFEKTRFHHVVFYIEPLHNIKIYDPNCKCSQKIVNDPEGDVKPPTALLFEYTPRLNRNLPPGAKDYDDTAARKKRKRRHEKEYSEENIVHSDNDVIHIFKFKPAVITHDMFDTRRQETSICELCIWLQPNFAQKFALGGSVQHGAVEIIEIILFLNYIFRSTDFNQDGLPENIGFSIKRMLINDDIRVTTTGPEISHPGKPISEDSDTISEDSKTISEDYLFSSNVNTVSTKSVLALATKNLAPIFDSCCASLAFIYHNMAPAMVATNLRGLCTDRNIAVVSGILQANKLTNYDLFRATFHALGHLFGAHHDDMTNARCHETTRYSFLNPFVMHPVDQLNVGMRPGSHRMSPCTKDQITQFLASSGAACLISRNETFCGNGLLEKGEKCDCGSLWQCHSPLTFDALGPNVGRQKCDINLHQSQ
ncbi:unnamed protein product [Allacma fusca]|uniref:Peptidase M12B domain-containing protein n=1 Tax=Allacma fusca TaxID=39272 RepID=A0A8J2LEU9_9HEXA|nr:unnamed protein product [Allacma fusca]